MPFGIRKLVEIGRALCLKPKLILLDEPSSGLNPEETEDLVFQIEDIKEELSVSILMIEHDMNLVSKASDRVLALADGKVLVIGKISRSPRTSRSNKSVPRITVEKMLRAKNIESYYGPIAAIKGLTMEIQSGKITVLLGANGAGKTTALKTLSGAIEPQKGKITFNKSISRIKIQMKPRS